MIDQVFLAWDSATAVEDVGTPVQCRSSITLAAASDHPRFAYVSVASPIEQLLSETSSVHDRSGGLLSNSELADRLLDGEVAAVIASPAPTAPFDGDVFLPAKFSERRQQLRTDNVLARFLIRQIGLEEVSAHRGAPAQLYTDLAELWSRDLSLCIDPAMLLTLGADRQRYVDANFTDRATDRLPRALGRLRDLGVRSYPRLVIV